MRPEAEAAACGSRFDGALIWKVVGFQQCLCEARGMLRSSDMSRSGVDLRRQTATATFSGLVDAALARCSRLHYHSAPGRRSDPLRSRDHSFSPLSHHLFEPPCSA